MSSCFLSVSLISFNIKGSMLLWGVGVPVSTAIQIIKHFNISLEKSCSIALSKRISWRAEPQCLNCNVWLWRATLLLGDQWILQEGQRWVMIEGGLWQKGRETSKWTPKRDKEDVSSPNGVFQKKEAGREEVLISGLSTCCSTAASLSLGLLADLYDSVFQWSIQHCHRALLLLHQNATLPWPGALTTEGKSSLRN